MLNLPKEEILALTIYGEARGEPIDGQIAVGCVIRNRVERLNSYIKVCLAKEQFSCWNTNDPNYVVLTEMADKLLMGQDIVDLDYQQCQYVASGIINWFIKDITNGAKYYMVTTLLDSSNRPRWAQDTKTPIQIGKQTFFNV